MDWLRDYFVSNFILIFLSLVMLIIAILICSIFVVFSVLFEIFDSNGELELLNVSIVSGTMVYYLFLYTERTQIDTLTGLFNHETYYRDSLKMGERATGVIQYDMNGLKKHPFFSAFIISFRLFY